MIKGIRFIPIATLLVLAACTQDELPQESSGNEFPGVITFSSSYTATRAEGALRTEFREKDKVGVLGYCKSENAGVDFSDEVWNTKKPFARPDIFYNQELTYSGTGSWEYNWEGTPDLSDINGLHPWLENDAYTYTFFAYYPYAKMTNYSSDGKTMYGVIDGTGIVDADDEQYGLGTITLTGKNETGDPSITYTMPHHPANNTSSLDWWIVPDLMLAYKVDHLKKDGPVELNFRHLFCAFEFRVNNYNQYPVTISDLYLQGGNEQREIGFYKSVTVVGQESDYSVGNDIYFGRFKLIEGKSSGGFICPAATEENGELLPTSLDITSEETGHVGEKIVLLFIPDADGKLTTDGNESLNISLQATGSNGSSIDGTRSMNLKDVTFKAGWRSVFNINIVGNDFIIQMRTESDWEDGEVNDSDNDIVFE